MLILCKKTQLPQNETQLDVICMFAWANVKKMRGTDGEKAENR